MYRRKNHIISFKNSKKFTQMNHDYWLTEELRRLTYTFVDFIQNGYNIKVKKITCKFIRNEKGRYVFIGAKNLWI